MGQFLVLAAVVLAAALLFATNHVLARKRGSLPERKAGGSQDGMRPLMEAAEAVYRTARNEHLVLAAMAERDGDAVRFFARNMANVVGAWQKNADGGFEAAPGDGDLQSLYIRHGDIDSYLRWARTVQ